MLNKLILLSLGSWSLYTFSSEDIERAIKKSDITELTKILEKTELSEKDFGRFIDLAQSIIYQKKSDYECYLLNKDLPEDLTPEVASGKSTMWEKIFKTLGIGGLVGVWLLAPIESCIPENSQPAKGIAQLIVGLVGLCTISSLIGFLVTESANSRLRSKLISTTIKKLYDNAIEAKNLLIKKYNGSQDLKSNI